MILYGLFAPGRWFWSSFYHRTSICICYIKWVYDNNYWLFYKVRQLITSILKWLKHYWSWMDYKWETLTRRWCVCVCRIKWILWIWKATNILNVFSLCINLFWSICWLWCQFATWIRNDLGLLIDPRKKTVVRTIY